ncbi:MAG TPA: hypothetical protein VFT31_15460 [Kribbella sp.]|nr:hypothetical protein [Kribbella sp.]
MLGSSSEADDGVREAWLRLNRSDTSGVENLAGDTLLAVLDPEAVLRADQAAVRLGVSAEVLGSAAVAGTFARRAQAARLALVDGLAGLVWASGGRPRVVIGFTVTDGKIVGIDLIADPDRLSNLDLVILED